LGVFFDVLIKFSFLREYIARTPDTFLCFAKEKVSKRLKFMENFKTALAGLQDK